MVVVIVVVVLLVIVVEAAAVVVVVVREAAAVVAAVFLSSKLSHLVKEHSPSQAQLNGIYCLMDSQHPESSPAFKTALKTHLFRSAY